MLEKIINWLFGGIFRTLGRLIGFVIFGIIIAVLLSLNNVKITQLLGIDYVNAATTTSWSTSQVKLGTCYDGNCSYGSNYDTPKTFTGSDVNYPVYSLRWRVKSSNGLSSENTYTFTVGYKSTPDSLGFKEIYLKGNGDVSRENATCVSGVDNSNYKIYKCTFTPLEDYSSSDYLYITIDFYQSYVTSISAKISKFEERVGTNAVITQQTNEIINQNQENTENIINNQNENTQNIINNQNENSQQQIESQMACKSYDKSDIVLNNKAITNNGVIYDINGYGLTDYLNVRNSIIKVLSPGLSYDSHYCFYTKDKILISCTSVSNTSISVPTNAYYLIASINGLRNVPLFSICKNGNQATNDNILDLIHDINKTDTDEALAFYEDLFNSFTENNHGIAGIISAPLEMITNISTGTCSPIVVGGGTGYFENASFTLPCLTPLYEQWFPDFLELYQTITFGLISYWIVVDIFRWLKSFRNPNDDRIEVVDL